MLFLKAKDADMFVRVWMKEGSMLFTGTISHEEDGRFELEGLKILMKKMKIHKLCFRWK